MLCMGYKRTSTKRSASGMELIPTVLLWWGAWPNTPCCHSVVGRCLGLAQVDANPGNEQVLQLSDTRRWNCGCCIVKAALPKKTLQ
jgi:hypothetical protein